jgi:hypothetical protein
MIILPVEGSEHKDSRTIGINIGGKYSTIAQPLLNVYSTIAQLRSSQSTRCDGRKAGDTFDVGYRYGHDRY